MKRLWLIAAAVMASGAAGLALAQGAPDPFTGGSAEAGAAKAATCVACHGPGGNSGNPVWPKLAGQHSAYTYAQLKLFKSGERKDPLMSPQAAPLSEQDMKDLAAYFAQQKAQPGVASADAVKTAEPLYRVGGEQRDLPACAACHGPQGGGNAAAAYPRIGGQHASYSAKALRQYRDVAALQSLPEGAPRKIMATVAAQLTDAEIEALASYVNGLH